MFCGQILRGIELQHQNIYTSQINKIKKRSSLRTPSLRRLMRKRDRLHARKDPLYKTYKHTAQKKLRSVYWQYVKDIITQ